MTAPAGSLMRPLSSAHDDPASRPPRPKACGDPAKGSGGRSCANRARRCSRQEADRRDGRSPLRRARSWLPPSLEDPASPRRFRARPCTQPETTGIGRSRRTYRQETEDGEGEEWKLGRPGHSEPICINSRKRRGMSKGTSSEETSLHLEPLRQDAHRMPHSSVVRSVNYKTQKTR